MVQLYSSIERVSRLRGVEMRTMMLANLADLIGGEILAGLGLFLETLDSLNLVDTSRRTGKTAPHISPIERVVRESRSFPT